MMVLPVISLEATGRRIETLRIEAGLSVKDLQEIFGFSTPNAIYKWQRGMCLPTIDNLIVLAMVFEVSMEEILVIDGEGSLEKGA